MNLETFFEKFEMFADAPNAVGKMRELVRHLAITGRLVTQDPDDEPALTFLNEIALHKSALAKAGKIRISTAVVPIPPNAQTRAIPPAWTWTRFGDIMINRDGERIPVSKEVRATKSKTYDYYGASGVIDKIDDYLFDKPLLLVGEDGANLINRSTPIAFIARGQYWVNNHAHVLDGICEDFLRYVELHINAINLETYVTGSAQPKMNQAKMNSIPIALPPLAEQKRIVAKVDELMALCDRLETQQQQRETQHAALARASLSRFADAPTPANLNFLFHPSYSITPGELRKTILTLTVRGNLVCQDSKDEPACALVQRIRQEKAELVRSKQLKTSNSHTLRVAGGEDYALPSGWQWTLLDEITDIGTGTTPAKSNREYYVGGTVPWITSAATNNEFIERAEQFVTPRAVEECGLKLYPEGSLIIALYGQGKTRGQVGQLLFNSTTNQACAVIAFFGCGEGTRDYIRVFFKQKYDELREMAAGGAQPNLSGGMIRLTKVPLPPLPEQRRIVAKVDQLMSLVDQLETQLAASRATAEKLMEALVAELTSRS